MTDFVSKTKTLLEKATKGPWAVEDPLGPDILSIVSEGESPEVYDWRHVAQIGVDTPEEAYRDKDPSAIFKAEADANAALIVHLVNNAHLIVEMVEEAKHLAKLTRHLQERPDDDSREVRVPLRQLFQMRTILSKLNGDVA